jgi:glycosyltransferase involved in cell wall biosynthesis
MALAEGLDRVVEPADIWHGMWAGSLPALVRLSRRHGGRTIYDSRDVYMESRDFATASRPLRGLLAAVERRYARRVDRVLTVNESYADLIERGLGVRRPPVVMNCSARWTPPDPRPDLIRAALDLPPSTMVALYQGQLSSARGIEEAMDAILEVPEAVLVLLGFGRWKARLAELVAAAPYEGRVFLLPPVPPDDLLAWTASADVSVMAIAPTTVNHQHTTPQKLLESLAAGVPVVASNLPGMASIVRATGCGVLVDPTSPASIAQGIRTVVTAPADERAALRRKVLEAAHRDYSWESQLGTLMAVYLELLAADGLGQPVAR